MRLIYAVAIENIYRRKDISRLAIEMVDGKNNELKNV